MPAEFWRTACRRLFAIYLFVAMLALAFPHRPAGWPILALLHIVGILVLLGAGPLAGGVRRIAERWPRLGRVAGDWYPLVLVPALYTELAALNVAIYNGRYFDDVILGWEELLFGGQPSRDWAAALPHLPLSEFLHFSYISYYLIIYGPFVWWYLRGRRADHQRAVFTIMLTFFAHYIFFIYFPVQGPRYLFPAPSGEIADGAMYNLAHRILEAGSSRGAAFPSSHVGVSFVQTALAFVLLKRWAPVLLVLSIGLAVGAVYGGFHYATDALIGLAYGLLLFAVAPGVAGWLNRTP